MQINTETVKKIAHLSRLEFTPEEELEMAQELSKILTWMDQLNEVDTQNVAPLIHLSAEINVMNDDVVHTHLPHEKALANAPKKDTDYFRVPKVIE